MLQEINQNLEGSRGDLARRAVFMHAKIRTVYIYILEQTGDDGGFARVFHARNLKESWKLTSVTEKSRRGQRLITTEVRGVSLRKSRSDYSPDPWAQKPKIKTKGGARKIRKMMSPFHYSRQIRSRRYFYPRPVLLKV